MRGFLPFRPLLGSPSPIIPLSAGRPPVAARPLRGFSSGLPGGVFVVPLLFWLGSACVGGGGVRGGARGFGFWGPPVLFSPRPRPPLVVPPPLFSGLLVGGVPCRASLPPSTMASALAIAMCLAVCEKPQSGVTETRAASMYFKTVRSRSATRSGGSTQVFLTSIKPTATSIVSGN